MVMFGNAQTCRCHLMLGRGAGRVASDKPEPNAGSSNGRARSDHPGLLGREGKPAGRRGAGSLASDRRQMAKALRRRPDWLIGMVARWPSLWGPAFTRSGVCCGEKESTCNGYGLGV